MWGEHLASDSASRSLAELNTPSTSFFSSWLVRSRPTICKAKLSHSFLLKLNTITCEHLGSGSRIQGLQGAQILLNFRKWALISGVYQGVGCDVHAQAPHLSYRVRYNNCGSTFLVCESEYPAQFCRACGIECGPLSQHAH